MDSLKFSGKNLLSVLVLLTLLPLFGEGASLRHRVRRGETLWRISRKYSVTVSALKKANPSLSASSLRPGRVILVPAEGKGRPRSRPRTYRVRRGDTLWSISRRFGVPVSRLKRMNRISGKSLKPGHRLRLSGAVSSVRRAVPRVGVWSWYRIRRGDSWWLIARRSGTTVSRLKGMNRGKRMIRGVRIRVPGSRNRITRKRRPVRRSRRRYVRRSRGRYFGKIPGAYRVKFAWPLRGKLVERFGIGKKWISNGITIRNSKGAAVRAAASGVVAYHGRKRGYGLMVIIRHPNNIYSVYTNLGRVGVSAGQQVSKRTRIGTAGALKGFSGHGVHFELYYRTRPVNPIRYLG